MRLALPFIVLIAALYGIPYVSTEARDTDRVVIISEELKPLLAPQGKLAALSFDHIRVMSLPPAPPGQFEGSAGAIVLSFLPPLQLDTMPLMPDIPAPVEAGTQDALPRVDPVAAPVLTEITPIKRTAATRLPNEARITGNALNMRTGPGSGFDAVRALNRGDRVQITGRTRGKWVPIRLIASGQEGWVFHAYIRRSG